MKEQRLKDRREIANQAKAIRQLSEVYAKANAEIRRQSELIKQLEAEMAKPLWKKVLHIG